MTTFVTSFAGRWMGPVAQRRSLRFVIALLIVAASAFPLVWVSQRGYLLLLAGLSGLLGALVLLRWPLLGLLGVVVLNLATPFRVELGGTRFDLGFLLLGLMTGVFALAVLRDVRRRPVPSAPVYAAVAMVVVALLALASGGLPWLSFGERAPLTVQAAGTAIFVLSAMAFLMASVYFAEGRGLAWATGVFLALGALVIGARYSPDLARLLRSVVPPGAVGSLFWTWWAALATAQGLFNNRLPWPIRGALVLLSGAIVVAHLFLGNGWVSGWLPPLVAIGIILWAGFPRLRLPILLAALLVGLLGAQTLYERYLLENNEYSLLTRLEAGRILGEIIRANPLLGIGPANYYWITPYFPILGWYVNFSSHNNYVDIAAQAGLLGLGVYLWFLSGTALMAWTNANRRGYGPFERAYLLGALGGIAGTAMAGFLGDWVIPFVYNVGLDGFRASVLGWLFMGGMVAVVSVRKRHEGSTGETAGTEADLG